MIDILNSPLFTCVFENIASFHPEPGSAYVAFEGVEERCAHFSLNSFTAASVSFVQIVREGDSDFDAQVDGGDTETYRLRSRKQLQRFWTNELRRTVYLDITGLRHHIWIPLLRAALDTKVDLRVVYVEPEGYKPSAAPTEGQIYDLSERINGISPIPGFASLSRSKDDFLFIPLLGFEGTRAAYLLEDVQPVDDRIIPVVGIPGFRPEHPFSTYLGNRFALRETNAWQRVEYADANCPFSLFYLLEDIAAKNRGVQIKVAVIGTKPHALGAALFVMNNTSNRELIYDHPVRKSERTHGVGRLLVYDVGAFHT